MRNDALFDHRRRHFLRGSLAAGAMALPVLGQPGSVLAAEGRGDAAAMPASIRALQPVAQRWCRSAPANARSAWRARSS